MATLEDLPFDQVLAIAKQGQGFAQLVRSIEQNPETRLEFLKLRKKLNPNQVIPELDAREPFEKKISEQNQKLEEMERRALERDINDRIKDNRSKIRAKYKVSDDQVTEIEKLMVEKKIPDYETAAEFFTMSRRVAEPTPNSISNPMFEMPKGDWAKGIGNKSALDKVARTVAYEAWNEATSGNFKGGLGPAIGPDA
jgi:hypothetical protein